MLPKCGTKSTEKVPPKALSGGISVSGSWSQAWSQWRLERAVTIWTSAATSALAWGCEVPLSGCYAKTSTPRCREKNIAIGKNCRHVAGVFNADCQGCSRPKAMR